MRKNFTKIVALFFCVIACGTYEATQAYAASSSSCALLPSGFSCATGDSRHHIPMPKIPAVPAADIKSCVLTASHSVDLGQPAPESSPDTSNIKSALSNCSVVELARGADGSSAFVSGPFTMPSGTSLVIDAGVTLYASRQASQYAITPTKSGQLPCGFYDTDDGKSCKPFITLSGSNGIFGGAISGGLAMGTIDGQGGQAVIYPDSSRPQCAYSPIPATVQSNPSWWDVANCADLASKASQVNHVQSTPVLIRAQGSVTSNSPLTDLTFYNVRLQNSPKGHISVDYAQRVNVVGIEINTPSDYASYGMPRAHNTDGVDLGGVTDATIINSYFNDGDDFIALDAGNAGLPTQNITIYNDHFYGGHGVSVGSITLGGISNVLVKRITIDGNPNLVNISGLQLKSDDAHGGKVNNITYEDSCLRNVPEAIWEHMNYESLTKGSNEPIYENIVFTGINIFNGNNATDGVVAFSGADPSNPITVALYGVFTDKPAQANSSTYPSSDADIDIFGKVNFTPEGSKVDVTYASDDLVDHSMMPDLATCDFAPAPFAISQNPKK